MDLQLRADEEFLKKIDKSRKIHKEKLMGILDEYIQECFADYKELLMEDIQSHLKELQSEAEQKISGPGTYAEIRRQVDTLETADFVRRKTAEFYHILTEKEKTCVDAVQRLVSGAGTDCDFVEAETASAEFGMEVLPEPDPADQSALEEIQEKKSRLNADIDDTIKKKEEAENTFRELVHKNAEMQAKMEAEKPEIKYITRKVRREGVIGFLVDLFGKAQTETITDDSEFCRWQEQVNALQKEYELQAREGNERIEELKNDWHEKEEEYDRLDTAQKQLEKKLREQARRAVLEELEVFLYGEDGLFDSAAEHVEHNFRLNAEKIRTAAWEG